MTAEERVKAFHDHLDKCEQCREHPFDLCPIGQSLFLATALKRPSSGLNPDVTS